MRDDIHKRVPRPPRVQRWVKYAARESDRLAGRSAQALKEVLVEVATRDIRASLFNQLQQGQAEMFTAGAASTERQIRQDFDRLVATGCERDEALSRAVAWTLQRRAQAELRAAEPVLLACNDKEARECLIQLRRDVANLDYRLLAEDRITSQLRVCSPIIPLSANENLLGVELTKARL
jgi:hypothetical protein